MQQPQTPPSPIRASLLYGLIFGAIIGAIDIIYALILDLGHLPFLTTFANALFKAFYRFPPILFNIVYNLIINAPLYTLLLVAFLLAGVFAARKSQKVSAGLLAALWTGLLFLVIDLLIVGVLFSFLIVFPQYARSGTSASDLASIESSTISAIFTYGLITNIAVIAIGLGLGALGGLMGRGSQGVQPYPTPYAFQPYQTPVYANPQQFPGGPVPQQPGLTPQPGSMPQQPMLTPQPGPIPQQPGLTPQSGQVPPFPPQAER